MYNTTQLHTLCVLKEGTNLLFSFGTFMQCTIFYEKVVYKKSSSWLVKKLRKFGTGFLSPSKVDKSYL